MSFETGGEVVWKRNGMFLIEKREIDGEVGLSSHHLLERASRMGLWFSECKPFEGNRMSARDDAEKGRCMFLSLDWLKFIHCHSYC